METKHHLLQIMNEIQNVVVSVGLEVNLSRRKIRRLGMLFNHWSSTLYDCNLVEYNLHNLLIKWCSNLTAHIDLWKEITPYYFSSIFFRVFNLSLFDYRFCIVG